MIHEKPFHLLRARDVMSRNLLLIPDDATIQEAGRRLVRDQISGAPVVDCDGKLVGVISSLDFVRYYSVCGKPSLAHDLVYAEWQLVDVDQLPEESVRRCMTVDPVTATEDTPLTELARMMIDAHIHRIIIVDEEGMPKGIVATSDILGAVAQMNLEASIR